MHTLTRFEPVIIDMHLGFVLNWLSPKYPLSIIKMLALHICLTEVAALASII